MFIKEYHSKDIDLNCIHCLSREMCEKYNVIPRNEDENNIFLLGSNVKQDEIKYMKFFFKKNIVYEEISEENFKEIKSMILGMEEGNLEDNIIFKGIKDNASDIHFEPQTDWVNIRYRINGTLVLVYKISREEYLKAVLKIKLMCGMDIAEKRRPQDGKSFIEYNDKKYDLRVSIIPLINGEKIVIRILYCDNFNYTLESLGFTEDKADKIRKMISAKNGIVIVCGPTGSGKSSTLYTILKELDAEKLNITTLEDPVEVQMMNINQMNLNKKIDMTFANGLRSILRQDPDVIMIGEIRDEETAEMAIRASVTGHKVYTTIHCKSPEEVFIRLENMGIKPYMIKESLVGIISQRLIKILCSNCKSLDDKNTFRNTKIYKKCGCEACRFTGYEGRQAVGSVCLYNYRTNNDNNAFTDNLSNKSMKEDVENLLVNGKISYEDYIEFIEGERLDDYGFTK